LRCYHAPPVFAICAGFEPCATWVRKSSIDERSGGNALQHRVVDQGHCHAGRAEVFPGMATLPYRAVSTSRDTKSEDMSQITGAPRPRGASANCGPSTTSLDTYCS